MVCFWSSSDAQLLSGGAGEGTLVALKSRLVLNASVSTPRSCVTESGQSCRPRASCPGMSSSWRPGSSFRPMSGSTRASCSPINRCSRASRCQSTGAMRCLPEPWCARGEAVAEVIATGPNTRFGHAADLVRSAHLTSTQQKAVLRVVVYLAGINVAITALLIAYAWHIAPPLDEIIPLALIAILASVPRALPATLTLATAIGARVNLVVSVRRSTMSFANGVASGRPGRARLSCRVRWRTSWPSSWRRCRCPSSLASPARPSCLRSRWTR